MGERLAAWLGDGRVFVIPLASISVKFLLHALPGFPDLSSQHFHCILDIACLYGHALAVLHVRKGNLEDFRYERVRDGVRRGEVSSRDLVGGDAGQGNSIYQCRLHETFSCCYEPEGQAAKPVVQGLGAGRGRPRRSNSGVH